MAARGWMNMSSINTDLAARFSVFFQKLGNAAGSSRSEYFPTRSDLSAPTYYRTREADPQNYIAEFEGAQLAEALRLQWSARPELLELIPDVVALFELSAGDDGEEGGDVSPFIYEMF